MLFCGDNGFHKHLVVRAGRSEKLEPRTELAVWWTISERSQGIVVRTRRGVVECLSCPVTQTRSRPLGCRCVVLLPRIALTVHARQLTRRSCLEVTTEQSKECRQRTLLPRVFQIADEKMYDAGVDRGVAKDMESKFQESSFSFFERSVRTHGVEQQM